MSWGSVIGRRDDEFGCYQLELADTWFDGGFSCFSAADSRCALISLTRSTTSGWLNFPSLLSKNSWCVLIQLSRFSYSNACITKSNRSKSFTNFDSGVWFSSYSYNEQKRNRIHYSIALFFIIVMFIQIRIRFSCLL